MTALHDLAEALLFTTIGVIGILLLAKRTGKIINVRPYLDPTGNVIKNSHSLSNLENIRSFNCENGSMESYIKDAA